MPEIQISHKLLLLLYFLPIFLISLSVHEFAHAVLAYKFGDDTEKKQGRLTLNPIKHLDLVGSIIMPILAFTSGFMLIGWAKPVPVNASNFSSPLKHDAIVSAAGPLSNLLLSFIFFISLFIVETVLVLDTEFLKNILWFCVYFNVFL